MCCFIEFKNDVLSIIGKYDYCLFIYFFENILAMWFKPRKWLLKWLVTLKYHAYTMPLLKECMSSICKVCFCLGNVTVILWIVYWFIDCKPRLRKYIHVGYLSWNGTCTGFNGNGYGPCGSVVICWCMLKPLNSNGIWPKTHYR